MLDNAHLPGIFLIATAVLVVIPSYVGLTFVKFSERADNTRNKRKYDQLGNCMTLVSIFGVVMLFIFSLISGIAMVSGLLRL